MGIGGKILICIFAVGLIIFIIVAGISLAWIAICDTAFGRAIDEIMTERIERWKERDE